MISQSRSLAAIRVAVFATTTALAVGAVAQSPKPSHHPEVATPRPSATGGHLGDHGTMKAECQKMMDKHREMESKFGTMDATLDHLVAAMNAAKGSKEPGAMEKSMAAVLNELVSQRKVIRSTSAAMQSEMMVHMAHHQGMHETGGPGGPMMCPMMTTQPVAEPKAEHEKH